MMSLWKALLGFIVSVCCVYGVTEGVTTVFIEECKAGKYFWKEKLPTEFYACLTLPRRAVKLRCPPGTYMCNTGPQFFQPCMCKGNSLKYYKQYGISQTLYQTQNNKLAEGEAGSANEIDSSQLRSMMSTESTLNDVPKGRPEGKEGIDDYYKVEPSMLANGCPDDFRQVDNAHMYFGTKVPGSLMECQKTCMDTAECLGVDWNKKKLKCYILSLTERGTIRFGLNYNAYTIHYRRTYCVSTVASGVFPTTTEAPTTTADSTTVNLPPTTGFPRNLGGSSNQVNNNNNNNNNNDNNKLPQIVDINGFSDNSGNRLANTNPTPMNTAGVTTPIAPTPAPTVARTPATPVPSPTPAPNRAVPAAGFFGSTTTIPDSGCPYSFEKIEGMSHPFGINITINNKFADPEECKYWCLINSFCAGVDFNSKTKTCYYLREIDTNLVSDLPEVTHYRITDCEPPLKCWSQDTVVEAEDDLSIIDEVHPQTACNGVCFVSQTLGSSYTSIQRGCLTVTDPALKPPNGCSVDSTLMTIVCFCDTPRCNGLSINALASQMLYMPLDNDMTDHSGIGRHGQTPTGSSTPNFQCLDKAVNCAALFTGNECITVSTLATTAWGSQNSNSSVFVPTATFAVWFKRVSSGSGFVTQGIFGNSIDMAQDPSWQIIAEELDNYISAGVSTTNNPTLNDYPYMQADNDEWHLAVLTYDGRDNVTAMQFPVLKLYVDCVPVMGNSRADSGEIGVRNQPVSVGCVQGQNFVGFIDEARIFSTVLTINDIRALKAMRDTNFFW